MKIAFIGAGYVGLVTGVMMAHLGHDVLCLDKDQNKIADLQKGIIPIYEDELEIYLKQAIESNKINFSYNYNSLLAEYEIIFIAVGTPSLADGSVNLEYIREAIQQVVQFARAGSLIVIKSTVPPGTCESLQQELNNSGYNFEIASNPEFLREGHAVHDFLHPYRIVLGVESARAERLLRKLYLPLKDVEIILTDLKTAELIKYSANAFLAIKIAFINEMANLCEAIGSDIENLAKGIGLDPRIGRQFLKAGPGFGGSCFPKDTLGLAQFSKTIDMPSSILTAAIEANQRRPQDMVDKINGILGADLVGMKLCVLGLSFKAGTDDVRDSPAIEIVKLLMEQCASVTAYDPKASENAKKLLPTLMIASSIREAVRDAQAVIILTEWEEFKDLTNILASYPKPIIIDLRNILNPELVKQQGFKYYSIGRKN